MRSLDFDKQIIAQRFGRSAQQYHVQAEVQKDCAKRLIEFFQAQAITLPEGPILEIGCGTGFVTQQLVETFPTHPLLITDLSPEMLEFCQGNLKLTARSAPIAFQPLDGEQLSGLTDTYSLIVSGFVLQWFKSPLLSLRAILKHLKPGGGCLIAFPSRQSFPEWQNLCQQLQVPCTLNHLPDIDEIINQLSPQFEFKFHTEKIAITYSCAIDFFREMKAIGVGTNLSTKHLSAPQFKQLIKYWDQQTKGNIKIHYHVAFGWIQT
jgi:malonyl-CoA O-methyltransferase